VLVFACFFALSFAAPPPLYAAVADIPAVPPNVHVVEMLHWHEVRELLPTSTQIQIFDIGTGIVYHMSVLSSGNHADVEPVTAWDTFLLLESFSGVMTWSARPVWVTVGDRTFSAAIHSMPHDISIIQDNDMDGHVCLHFYGSTQHVSPNPVYHDVIVRAQTAFENMRHSFPVHQPEIVATPEPEPAPEPTPISSPEPAPEAIPVLGVPSNHEVRVNGQIIPFAAYNIGGNNFFRLRDVAFAINGTRSQFDVAWDGNLAAVNLLPGHGYVPIGTEMAAGNGQNVMATPTANIVLVAGSPINLRAYNIDGYNYFMLRDLGAALGFMVEWDDVLNAVIINTQ